MNSWDYDYLRSYLNDLLNGKVVKVETYKENVGLNYSYTKARICIDLNLPEDTRLYYILRGIYADNKQV